MVTPYSLYLHIPFCVHRCAYCDFNTYASIENLIPDYVGALCREIELSASSAGEALPVHTIFFGGGTPSLLTPAQVDEILTTIRSCFTLLDGAEITLEANPGTLSLDQLKDLRGIGVNRLSLGMQSSHPGELTLLERQHDLPDVEHSVQWAREAGFDNLNLDLMFAIPYQDLDMWDETLARALSLQPDHFSLYALTLEHGTPMQRRVELGQLPEPDPDLAADMYELASQRMESAGFRQYEISNWAMQRDDGILMSCRHNLQYWRGLPYLGFGAGAHGYAAGVRTANVLAPAAYISRLKAGEPQQFPRTTAAAEVRELSLDDEIGETMMMGLRLVDEGVTGDAFRERFGMGLEERFHRQINKLQKQGLVEWDGYRLHLTRPARFLSNRVFVEFI